jgi:hypothetical protein
MVGQRAASLICAASAHLKQLCALSIKITPASSNACRETINVAGIGDAYSSFSNLMISLPGDAATTKEF